MPPPPRSPLATARPWDLVAASYQDELVPMFTPYADAALELAGVASGARVADVACGPGTLALRAAARGLLVDALDVAPEMIARLEAIAPATVRAVVGDGLALPWPDGTFAAAFSLFGLMYFPDRARGYAELARVLAPGGRAIVTSWPPVAEAPVLARVLQALAAADPVFAGPPRPVLATAADHHAEMAAAGFRDVRVERLAPVTPFASAGAFWEHLGRTSASMALARIAVGEERWRAIAAEVATSLATSYGDGPIDVVLPAWIAVGVR